MEYLTIPGLDMPCDLCDSSHASLMFTMSRSLSQNAACLECEVDTPCIGKRELKG